jgi:glyoxylase-like metal-dependent hydrolase (beta-lactamase superfamily II)
MNELRDGWLRLETNYADLCGVPLWLHAIADGDQLVLLDSGVASTPQATLRDEFRRAGLRIEDLTLVVNSHAHPDHMGGNAALRALSRTAFAAPAAEADWLEDNDRLLRELWGASPEAYDLSEPERAEVVGLLDERVRIDRFLRDGDTIDLPGGALRIVTTSGHSPGHLAVHDPARRLLFTFDDVQGRGLPLPHGQPTLAPLYLDCDRYETGLRHLRTLDFDLLIPAHGPALDRAAGLARIDESLAFVADADAFTLDHLDRHGSTGVRDLAEAIGTKLGAFGGVNLQTVSIARAHLNRLTRQGAAEPRWHRRGV